MNKNHPFHWTDNMQTVFDKMRLLVAADMLSVFPDQNKHCDVYTDSLDCQVCACIIQDGQPVIFYSKKLNSAQTSYTTTGNFFVYSGHSQRVLVYVALC
jgi:hypothetical protein